MNQELLHAKRPRNAINLVMEEDHHRELYTSNSHDNFTRRISSVKGTSHSWPG